MNTSIPTDTLDVVLDILDEYAVHLAIAQTDAEYARENDYSVIIANDIARIDEVRRVLRAAEWMRADRVNGQPMTLPVSPVWVSNESHWNGGWWAPGCCDKAKEWVAGIRICESARFQFDHDEWSDDVGCFLPDPVFCPWCGALIPREVPENPANPVNPIP